MPAFVLVLAMLAAPCEPTLDWGAGNALRLRVDTPRAELMLRRYTNAVQLSVTGADGAVKSSIEVEGGPVLVRGTVDAREFVDAAMPFELPIQYLHRRYPSPCGVPASERFRFRIDKDPVLNGATVEVSGTVRRQGAAVDYELLVEPSDGARPMKLSGRWEHVADAPIPEDLDVRGWKPVVENDRVDERAAPATIAEARAWRRGLPSAVAEWPRRNHP